MAIAKVILNGNTLMDVTSNTNTSTNMLNGIVGTKNDGTTVTGGIATKSSATYTPSTVAQTISSGVFLTGIQTIEAIPSAYIIPSGTSSITSNGIYDITSYASVDVNVSGGGGDHSAEDGIIDKTISGTYENSRVTTVGSSAFYRCASLTTASFPSATSIGDYAFYSCTSLTTANFPSATSIGGYAFAYCSSLTTASFPSATSIGGSAFYSCTSLTTANFPSAISIGGSAFAWCSRLTTTSFPSATSIGVSAFAYCSSLTTASFPNATIIGSYAFASCFSLNTASFPAVTTIYSYAFRSCYRLLSLYLLVSSVPTLSNINAFESTPISNYTTRTGDVYGSIYVPASLYNSFITATNWSEYAARFVSI